VVSTPLSHSGETLAITRARWEEIEAIAPWCKIQFWPTRKNAAPWPKEPLKFEGPKK
jgi:hypothetical protein